MTRFLHGAAQFWRGSALVAVLVLGGFLYYAYTAPEVYESDSLIELTNERGPDASTAASEALRTAIFDSRTLERIALDASPHVQRDADKGASSVIDRARSAIDLRPSGDARFTVAFRAPTAEQAHHGCDTLVTVAGQRLSSFRPASGLSPQEDARQRARVVEERTRELASFVAQHPELAGKKSESGEAFLGVPGMRPPSTPAPAPTTDSVLPILQLQKVRLEERIAYVEKVELGGAEDTDKLAPGDSLARMDRASLQKMLVQVKAAIAARQAAAERARANAPSEPAPEGTASAESASVNPVQAEWQRLVQAVVDAQQQAAQGRDAASAGLHVVRAANTPSFPILPNRRLLALVGATAGLWMGILWAFARVGLGHVRVAEPTKYSPEGLPAFPLEGEAAEAAPVVPAETTSSSRLAAAKIAPPVPAPLPNVPSSPALPKVPATPTPPKVATTPAPPKAAIATPSVPLPPLPDAAALAKTESLPSFPMEADSAMAAADATSASRLAATKSAPVPPPVAPKPAPTPAHAPPALAATTPAHTVESLVAEPPKRGALPSFPMDAELAKAVDEATSASRAAPARSPSDPPSNLPKVIIAPEATIPGGSKSGALPSFPMESETAVATKAVPAPAPAAAPPAAASAPAPAPAHAAAAPASAPAVAAPVDAPAPAPESAPAPIAPAPEPAAAPIAPSPAPAREPAPAAVPIALSPAPAREPAPAAEPIAPAPAAAAHALAASSAAVEAAQSGATAKPLERVAPAAGEKGLPVLGVAGARSDSGVSSEAIAPRAPERSPYAAVAEAARISSIPPPVEPTLASSAVHEPRRPSRHPSWSSEGNASRASSRSHTSAKSQPRDDGSIKPLPIASVEGGRIEASPIMGIEEGKATAASGKAGISVYPPPVAPNAPAPAPGATMRLGSVAPGEHAASGGSGHPGRRVTQTLGTPLGMSPSTAPAFAWTPHAGFGAHQMPPRESDPPPGLASIPPAPKPPSHVGPLPAPISALGSSRSALSPAVQSLPITPGRHAAAVQAGTTTVEAPSTALALANTHSSRTRSEPPAASSVVCDVPKGWAPHPTLMDSETSDELAALRDQLFRLAARECFVVGVSSGPEMAAYKSGVAGRLAWILAQPGHARVLLMEGDFDHPVVHRLMRIDMPLAAGFSEQMRRRMNGSPPGPWTIVRCAPNLYVLAEGLVRSPGLLPTVHFADSVNELRRAYDLIVIDGPAGGMSVDTRALDSVADGIVLAGEADLLDRAASWFGKKQLMAVVSAGQPMPNSR